MNRVRTLCLTVLSLSYLAGASYAGITYSYLGPTLGVGSPPYYGAHVEATVVFRDADLLALTGLGGTLAGDSINGNDDFIESFTFTADGLTIDSSNATYDFFYFVFSPTLEITQWETMAEAYLTGSSSYPELIYPRNPGDLVGNDDIYPNASDFQLNGAYAYATTSGAWTATVVPESSSLILSALVLAGAALVARHRYRTARREG